MSPLTLPQHLSRSPSLALVLRYGVLWLMVHVVIHAAALVGRRALQLPPPPPLPTLLWIVLVTVGVGYADPALRREWALWHNLGYSRVQLLALVAAAAFVGELVLHAVG